MTKHDCTAPRPSAVRLLVAATGLLSLGLTPVGLWGQSTELTAASATQPVSPTEAYPDSPGFSSSAGTSFGARESGQAAQGSSTPQSSAQPEQPSKRILGIIPNYRSVGIDAKLPPQSVGEKFKTSLQDTFDIGAFELAVVVSLEQYATVATPEFHRGGVAYGRYFWHAFADQSIENEMVEFVVPALTREDTRFYTLGRGGFSKRAGYALTRIFVVRSDSGKQTFNVGEVLGAGAAAAISTTYYPSAERSASQVLSQYAVNLGIDSASFFVREFDDDLTNLFRRHPHRHPAP